MTRPIQIRFNKGEPQRILNDLASDTSYSRKRTYDRSGSGTNDDRPNSLTIVSVVGAVGTRSQGQEEKRLRPLEPEDQKPSQEELDRAAAEFASPASSKVLRGPGSDCSRQIRGDAKIVESRSSITSENPNQRITSERGAPPLEKDPSGSPGISVAPTMNEARVLSRIQNSTPTSALANFVASKVPASTKSSSHSLAPQCSSSRTPIDVVGSDRLPIDAALVVPTAQRECLTPVVQQPVKYIFPVTFENFGPPVQPMYSIHANTTLETVYPVSAPIATHDDSCKAVRRLDHDL